MARFANLSSRYEGRSVSRIDDAFAAVGLRRLSSPAKIVAAVVAVGGAGLAFAAFILDFLSAHSSSTSVLIFPFMALYVAIAVFVVALVDSGVRHVKRRFANPS